MEALMPMVETSETTQERPELRTFGRERPDPGAYLLDLTSVSAFPLEDNGEPSTFRDIYSKLCDAKILKMPERFGPWAYETDSGQVVVTGKSGQPYSSGQSFVLHVLQELIELHQEGVNPHNAVWFYYGHDWSCDADEMYRYFVIHDGKIVRERSSFCHYDPQVLTKYKVDEEPVWRAQPYEHKAWEAYWYRKFYTETLTGQLMVLRPDEPLLYHFQRAIHDVSRDVEFVTLIKLYRFMWIIVPILAAIAYPAIKLYMAVLAGIFTLDLLWRCWATRKVGSYE